MTLARCLRIASPLSALLVLAGYACGNGKTPPLAARNALADSADQVMYHAKSILTDRGVMKAELHADTGYFFDDNTRIEMRAVETTFFTATGAKNAVLTSREGTYNTRTGNMEARGSVVVITQDGRRLTTPELRYIQGKNAITSDSAFVLTDSTHRQMTGIGFDSDPNMNDVRCLRACAGTAGVVSLTGGNRDSASSGAGGPTGAPSSGLSPVSPAAPRPPAPVRAPPGRPVVPRANPAASPLPGVTPPPSNASPSAGPGAI